MSAPLVLRDVAIVPSNPADPHGRQAIWSGDELLFHVPGPEADVVAAGGAGYDAGYARGFAAGQEEVWAALRRATRVALEAPGADR